MRGIRMWFVKFTSHNISVFQYKTYFTVNSSLCMQNYASGISEHRMSTVDDISALGVESDNSLAQRLKG